MWFSLGRDRKVWFKPSDTPSMTKNPFLLNLFYFLWFRIPPLRTKCFEYMILSLQHSLRGDIIIHLLLMSRLYITWQKFTSNTFIFLNFFFSYLSPWQHSFIHSTDVYWIRACSRLGIWQWFKRKERANILIHSTLLFFSSFLILEMKYVQ